MHDKVTIMFAQAQERQVYYANEKRLDIEFQEGDFVMINSDFVHDPIHTDRQSRKLSDKWLGPFRILQKISRVAYKLFIPKSEGIRIHPVIHIANLKRFEENVNPERFLHREKFDVPLPILDSQDESVFLVEDILNMKTMRRKREFLIKWVGFELPSWEPEENLRASDDFIPHLEEYLRGLEEGRLRLAARPKGRKNFKARIK